MPIETSCPKCGAGYRVKDEHAGKTFRCKKCQGTVSVPEPDAAPPDADPWDAEPWEDDTPTYKEAEWSPPRSAPVGDRPRRKSKKRRSRASDSMPVSVWVAVGCIGILMLFNVVGIIGQAVDGNVAGASCSFFRLMIEITVVIGLFKRSSSARWAAIVLSCIATVLFGLCGVGLLAMGATFAQEANVPEELMIFLAVVVLGQIVIEIPIIVSLLTPSADEWCNE